MATTGPEQRRSVLPFGARQGLALAALRAAHIDLVEVVAGSGLIEPEVFLATTPDAFVGEAIPVDVAQVAIGAALHKAHRHHIQLLDLAAGLLPGVLLIDQAILMNERTGAETLACFVVVDGLLGLGNEPQGELG